MTLIKNQLTQTEHDELDYELTMSAAYGTLTEQRYDELVEILVTDDIRPNSLLSIILEGKPEWRGKYIKRFNIQAGIRTA
jgi:hypothetical protein